MAEADNCSSLPSDGASTVKVVMKMKDDPDSVGANYGAFYDQQLPTEDRGLMEALKITGKCLNYDTPSNSTERCFISDANRSDLPSSYHGVSEGPLPLAVGDMKPADGRALKFGQKDKRKHERNHELLRMTPDKKLKRLRPKMPKTRQKKFYDHLLARVHQLGRKKVTFVNKLGPARWILYNNTRAKIWHQKCFEKEFTGNKSNDKRHQLYLAVYGSDDLC